MAVRVLLGMSLVIVVLLSVKLLRKTSGNSLLAWHALLFTTVFGPAIYFIQYINYDFPSIEATFVAYYDQVTANRIFLSLLLVNLIIIAYLLILSRGVTHNRLPEQLSPRASGSTPLMFYVGLIMVIIGAVSYLNTPMAQVILEAAPTTLGDYNAYYDVRFEAGQAGMSGLQQHINNFALITVLPLLTIYSLQRYLLKRERGWIWIWAALLAVWTVSSILHLAKAFIVNVAITNLITVLLVLRARPGNRRIPAVWAIFSTLAALVLVDFVYQVLGAARSPFESLLLLFERFVAIPMHTTWNHFVVFPDLYPHTHYTTSRALNLILAGGATGGPRDMMPYHIVSAILTGRAYNMNTGFVGSGWAEMGYLGVAQSALLIFGAFLIWDKYLLRSASKIPLAALVAFFLGRIWQIHNNDLSYLILSGGLLFGPAFYVTLFSQELQMKLPLIRSRAGISGLKTRSPREPVVQPSSTLAPPGRYRR